MQRHIPIHKCVKVYFSCSEKYNFPIISERKKARREINTIFHVYVCMLKVFAKSRFTVFAGSVIPLKKPHYIFSMPKEDFREASDTRFFTVLDLI